MNISRTPTQSQHVNWTKTLLYYAVHIGVAGSISFLATGSWWIALAVSVIEPAVQVLAWLTQCWEQHWEQRTQSHLLQQTAQSRTQRQKQRHPVQRHPVQRHAVQRYLARYARAF